MIISDLIFYETLEVPNTIIGGALANTDGEVLAGPGYAKGYVKAEAFGDSTATNARLFLTVSRGNFITISKAEIIGDAFAKDKDGDIDIDKIWDFDMDITLSM
jgi:hypothetical protein